MLLAELYAHLKLRLSDSNIVDALPTARILSCYYCNVDVSRFWMEQQASVKANQDLIEQALHLIIDDEYPVQYITHQQCFYANEFYVDKRVLIPRDDTETLVELVLNETDSLQHCTVFDIGTGSGIIGLTLAKAHDEWTVYASDISFDALDVCAINKKKLAVKNVTLLQGDMATPFLKKNIRCDILVSNPPYIDINFPLALRVSKHEPKQALYADDCGLAYYEAILNSVPKLCNANGLVYLEIGFDQKPAIEALVRRHLPNCSYRFCQDLNQNNRVLKILLGKD